MIEGLRSAIRAATALLLAAALGAALVESHGTGALHTGGPASADVAVEARHATQSAHFESSRLEPRKGCAACLLRKQSRAGVPDRPLAEPLAAGSPLAASVHGGLASCDPHRLPPTRAPPLV